MAGDRKLTKKVAKVNGPVLSLSDQLPKRIEILVNSVE
jgi:hypothetical protein